MKMFELAVGNTPCELKQGDYKKLAGLSEGYSGSDIAIERLWWVVALLVMIREDWFQPWISDGRRCGARRKPTTTGSESKGDVIKSHNGSEDEVGLKSSDCYIGCFALLLKLTRRVDF